MFRIDKNQKFRPRTNLRVIYFGDPTWGFTNAAIPQLRTLFSSTDLQLRIDHSSLTIECTGENADKEFAQAMALILHAASLPEFKNCLIGFAEGDAESFAEVGKIRTAALQNAMKT